MFTHCCRKYSCLCCFITEVQVKCITNAIIAAEMYNQIGIIEYKEGMNFTILEHFVWAIVIDEWGNASVSSYTEESVVVI